MSCIAYFYIWIASDSSIGLFITVGAGLYYLRNKNNKLTKEDNEKDGDNNNSNIKNELNTDIKNNNANKVIVDRNDVMNNLIKPHKESYLPYFSISVGNTNTSAIVIKNGVSKTITQFDGKYFKSCVSFSRNSDNYRISLESKTNKYSIVCDMMKYIGKKFEDINGYDLIDKPYKLVRGNDGYCAYEVYHNNGVMSYTPTYVLSKLLKFIKEEAFNRSRIEYFEDKYPVILTIPADFNNIQRKEMIKAAKMAGMEVKKLISEPIAASFAYLHNNSIKESNCNILVCDFGENSFESSIFNLNDKKMKVISNSRDDYIGGKDITRRLEEYIMNNIEKSFKITLKESDKLIIHKKCEEAKISLSRNDYYNFYIMLNDREYYLDISRELLNSLCEDLLQRTIKTINKSIDYGKVRNIDYIILIGGSSNIPRFQQIVKDSFKSIPIFKDTESQVILAEGSCWYFHSQNNGDKSHYRIIDVLLRSINIGLKQNKNIKLTYGIDLGTTYSSSAYVDVSNSVQIIQDRSGNVSIPSCVYYESNTSNIKVGEAAKQKLVQSRLNSKNFLYDSKRFIGKKYEEISKKDVESYPFELVEADSVPSYKLLFNNKEQTIHVVDVSCEILKSIHSYSIDRITHENVNEDEMEVVIGVPAAFTKEQREATKETAFRAGFKNVDLLSEPTAAALSYIFNNEIKKDECKMLVYDFGGGTFDVSIIELKNQTITILGTFGDEHLGGEDITMKLEGYVKNRIKEKFGIDVNKSEKLKSQIHRNCENVKINLSISEEVVFDIEMNGDNEYEETIARYKFNGLCSELFDKTIKLVNHSLERCNINKDELDYIILVGGSSRIPIIEELLKKDFHKSTICKSANTNEDVARGCAIHSKCLLDKNFNKYKIIDNSSIYSEDGKKNAIEGFKIETLIDRQCELPAEYKRIIRIGKDERIIRIYEDKLNSSDQMLIGEIDIGNHENDIIEMIVEAYSDGFLYMTITVDGKTIEKSIYYT